MNDPSQLALFDLRGSRENRGPRCADLPEAVVNLAARLPDSLYLGTSSWSFPGWTGLVYARRHERGELSRGGLGAYASHPMLRTVSVDRSYYGPLREADWQAYAAAVPAGFRFLVKAPMQITAPTLIRGRGVHEANPAHLDPAPARTGFMPALRSGLGERLAAAVLQFPPQGPAMTANPVRFTQRLRALLEGLGNGIPWAVELRDPELLNQDSLAVLADTGTRLCVSVHPRMPDLDEQLVMARYLGGPLIVRWNLHHGIDYETARTDYAPFDRLRREDPVTRSVLATAAVRCLSVGQPVFIAINNKAEGSAPLSVIKLGQQIARARLRASS